MLILERRLDECIMIGEDVVIKVVDVRKAVGGGYKVRLGISAPIEIPVHRMEVYAAIKRDERERLAAKGGA